MGMSESDLEHLFQRFYRSSGAIERAIQGPRWQDHRDEQPRRQNDVRRRAAAYAGPGGGMSPSEPRCRPLVLVADDDRDILQLVSFRLERADYEVVQAKDGEEALRLVKELRPDLAVLDVMMPKLNGYEVIREIRRDEETKAMPVILLTARVQEADVARGFEAGADDYLKKPFSPQELRARVQAILDRR
jgi:CheY-like chemotaxis protein